MMAAWLMTLFFCIPPQVYLYPAAQRCSVILPDLPASWSHQFSSFFSSCAYLFSFYGRVHEGIHRMPVRTNNNSDINTHIGRKSSGRSSKLSTRDRSWWWCWQTSRGSQLMLLFISWSLLLLLLGMPCLVKGAGSELLRVDGQAGYSEDWHRGNKGTDVLSQRSDISGRRYKHGEPPPGRADEDFSAKFLDESDLREPYLPPPVDSAISGDLGVNRLSSSEGRGGADGGGLEVWRSASHGLERLHFGGLVRDCLKVKCSPLSGLDVRQPSLDETPPLLSKGGSPTFQGPVSSAPHVAIIPPFLEWGSQPVFAPSVASLTVVNTCNSTRLKVFQPFSTDVQFYTLDFEEKVVDPGGELSIAIVFLPRTLGVAEAMLIVQTSAGGFLVQAQGRGTSSPYKVQSLQGLQVASGETLQYAITLHNPHDEVIRVGEVFAWPNKFAETDSNSNPLVKDVPCENEIASSNGVSHCADSRGRGVVQLASGRGDSGGIYGGAAVIQMRPPGQLEIDPHSSNTIAEFEFAALKVHKYSGSLHIKLSKGSKDSDDVLILPIDVQVREAKGDASPIQPVVDVLEFGVLTKEDHTSKVGVVLYNPGTEVVELEDIFPLLEDENIVRIEYRKGLVLPPNSETEVAVVTYRGIEETIPSGLFECHPRELLRDRKLIVRTNSSVSPEVGVPYRALVFHGSVGCDPAQGSVGFVPRRTNDKSGEVLSVLEGGALNEQRVHFVNGISVPLPLFMDLEMRARTSSLLNVHLVPSVLKIENVCCHESSSGHLAISVGHLSILVQGGLLYPLVQIGMEELLWLNVTNPSEEPLYVQVAVASKAEASDRSCVDMYLGYPGCSQGFTFDSPESKVMCRALDDLSDVFFLAEGSVVEAVVEPHGTTALGPVFFRPSERCVWSGLLALWNNLTEVEWVPLQGSGASGSLTFLNGDYHPIDCLQLDFNVTGFARTSDVIGEPTTSFLGAKMVKAACSQRVSRGFWAKNTGDINLDVKTLELVGGGCSAFGFEVDSCRGFTLAPGQSAELLISFQPDFRADVFQRDLQLITSAGVVRIPILANLPGHILPLCSEMAAPTSLERAFLLLAIVALVIVLGVFFRMLVQEMALSQSQLSTNRLKSVPQQKLGGRHFGPILFPSSHAVVVTKTTNSVVVSGRLKCSSGEPEVQSRTGDGIGASGPGRPKDNMKGLVRALKGVADSLTATMGSNAGSEEAKADLSPLPGLRVKIPSSAALIAQKSSSGSLMREAASPSGTHLRKGVAAAEKRTHGGRTEGLQAKIALEPLEESLSVPVKQQLPVSKSPKAVVCSVDLAFTKSVVGGNGFQQLTQQPLPLPVNPGLVSESPIRSPRKGNQFTQFRQVLSPKSQPLSPKSQAQSLNSGVLDKDKIRRKKRRSNVGTVKHGPASKGRSGSSSPSSSPASPATPASPSRPVSPLHHSELHPNMPNTVSLSPPGFSSSKSSGSARTSSGPPLSKLDVVVERRSSTGKPGTGSAREPSSPPVYRRSESLSVDVASTALREMAQAKATDLSWSALSGKGNRSSEKGSDGVVGRRGVPKDWATVARKATVVTTLAVKGEGTTDDRAWDRKAWVTQSVQNGGSVPALLPSATFPRREDRGSEWSFAASVEDEQELLKPVGSSPILVSLSTMPPAARAPGAKIAKPFLEDSGRDVGWGGGGEYTQGSSAWGEIFDKKNDNSPGCVAGVRTEDQPVYDIWGKHFGEISRSPQQIGPIRPGATEGALHSLSVLHASPNFFSSFPQPSFPSVDTPVLSPAFSGISSGFSVFSQAPDIETFCLPSTLFNSPKTVPSRPSVFSDITGGNNFGHSRNGFKGHGFGGSLPGSPRKARVPYSPPLGPSPMSSEFSPLVIPETTSDPSCSFWSGNLQEVFTTPIHSRS